MEALAVLGGECEEVSVLTLDEISLLICNERLMSNLGKNDSID